MGVSTLATAKTRPPSEPRHRPAAAVLPEDERRAAQDDADEHRRERDMERDPGRRVREREGGEEHHHDEDQPDVVGLPDRRQRLLDELALRAGAPAEGEQIPEAAAEIGAAGERVDGQPAEHGEGGQVGEGHGDGTVSRTWRTMVAVTTTESSR
jgi:hypothetical protein